MTHTMGRPMDSRPPDDVNPTGGLFMSLHKSQDARPMELSTRVSSQVLSLASPVFAAILSSNCAEGQAPRNATSQYSPSIALHEDSPGVMIWLCEVLQFKQDLTFDIYFSLLIESATLCDKYDLVSVLYPWSRRWLRDGPGPLHGVESHAEMHWISYGQGNEEHFWRASRSLMQSCTMEDLAALKNKPWPVIVPDVVLDCIETDCEAALIELQKRTEDVRAPLVKHECNAAKGHNRDKRWSLDRLIYIGYYFAQLSKSGLWRTTQ